MIAVAAALTFGITTPVVALAGRGVGPLTTAALLYLGACLSALLLGIVSRPSGVPLRRSHLARLGLVAFFGAAVAPTLLAWGLQRAGATTGSLLLNLEAVFTVLLARAFYREPVGRRVIVALSLMTLAGGLLALDATRSLGGSAIGALAIGGATLAWAFDNVLARPLSEQDPVAVVAAKAVLGAALTGILALALHESAPGASRALILLACGATGYGLSLRLYLLAQRRIGAARTGSIFALAPFVGAAVAWSLGARSAGLLTAWSAVLFGFGVFLHLTERHGHRHTHEPLEHEHAHRHDDGHHDHVHDPPFVGEHTHRHRHGPIEHDHPHSPDIHHGHRHTS
jgi:drug/metabolite transporter (DMT)-like permease